MFEISESTEETTSGARIKVIGVGGGGCNAVNTMIRSGLTGVEYVVANTDRQALDNSLASTKIQLGAELTKGLGAGANPEIGRQAALDEYEEIGDVLKDADMVFITAGMGGGTGTGAAPVIAKLVREMGKLTIGVVTKPFLFEGKKRARQAQEGIKNLQENVDSLITIPNQKLLDIAGQNLSLVDTFKRADEVLLNAVRGIADLINNNGYINADFADVSTVMKNKGLALMGTGLCSGEDRAIKAATDAISSPLLDNVTIDGATGIIINITGNSSLSMFETNQAVTLIMEAADEDAEIIFGTVIDDEMGDDVKVTVVATGLGGSAKTIDAAAQKSFSKPEEKIEEVAEIKAAPIAKEEAAPVIEAEEKIEDAISEVEDFIEEEPIVKLSSADEEEVKDEQPSKLVQSIREAASRYEASKQIATNEINESRTEQRTASSSRAKSIAERLGFLSFDDEDELDTPAFMRRNDSNENQLQ